MTKNQRRIVTLLGAWALVFGIVPAANAMHIMEGYLPVGYCIAWGVICIPFLAAGFFSIKKTLTGNRRSITLGHGRRFYFCYFITEDPICNRQLLPHDRYRPWRHLVWTERCQYSWHYRFIISGHSAGPRRIDNAGRKHFFNGNCRSLCLFWYLQALPENEG